MRASDVMRDMDLTAGTGTGWAMSKPRTAPTFVAVAHNFTRGLVALLVDGQFVPISRCGPMRAGGSPLLRAES